MTSLNEFNSFTNSLPEQNYTMPVLFIGHGSPMNGIMDNDYSKGWAEKAKNIPTPSAVLVVSAHWYTKGTSITAMDFPKTIHDFGGFPKELYEVQYPAPGSAVIAQEVKSIAHSAAIELNHEWGLDHGTWTVVRHMYPEATIPVLQLSIDYSKKPAFHFSLAAELMSLRKKGVLIIGSGNMVHNLGMVAWDKINEPQFSFDWASEINSTFKKLILERNNQALINYQQLGREADLAIPTAEHYLPLIYTLGLQSPKDEIEFFNDQLVGGSISMTSMQLG